MKKILALLIALSPLMIVTSCSDDKTVESQTLSPETYNIAAMARDIEEDTDRGIILSSANEADKTAILASVRSAKNAILALHHKATKKYLLTLVEAIKIYQGTSKAQKDEYKLDTFFVKAIEVAKIYAQKLDMDLDTISWKQFEYNFSAGVAPFGVYADVVNWSTDWQQDQPLALIKGTGTSSWLISPEFDLTDSNDASFEITQMYGADSNAREVAVEFNRAKFLKEVFKVRVSTDYQGGDPASAKWIDLKIPRLPTAIDFHKVKSGLISLERFAGKKITIAFYYNANSKMVGRHYLNWNIYDFKLYANQKIGEVVKRPGPVLTDKFSQNLGDFQNLGLSIDAPKWGYGSGGGKEFAVINSNQSEATTWLISPKYDLSNVTTVSVLIKQIAKNLNLKNARIFISSSYNGEDPTTAAWEQISTTEERDIADSWTDLMTGPISLEKYIGKSVVFGFEFTSTLDRSSTWEIINIDFIGEGSEIKKSRVDLKVETPEPPKDESKELLKEISVSDEFTSFSYEIMTGTPSDFFVNQKGETKSVRISGFKNKNVGVARLVSQVFDFSGLNSVYISVDHAINFAKNVDPKTLCKVYLINADTNEEVLLDFESFPIGNSFTAQTSGPVKIPEEFSSRKVKVAFEYKSEDPNFVTWDIFKLTFHKEK